jgi:dCMP deaminase
MDWNRRFVELAAFVSQWSKDPSTRVGAVLVGPDKEVLSLGYNGLPRGIADTPERLYDRPTKYGLVVHAEINAIMNAARNGVSTKGSTMYVIAERAGRFWGGAPCQRCAVETIQAGIASVIVPFPKDMPEDWMASCLKGREALEEAGVKYLEFDF